MVRVAHLSPSCVIARVLSLWNLEGSISVTVRLRRIQIVHLKFKGPLEHVLDLVLLIQHAFWFCIEDLA